MVRHLYVKNWCPSERPKLAYSMVRHLYYQNPHLKSMGNTVSAHIYEIKVFRPYPVILYRLRLDHSIHWWKTICVPRNDQNWRTRW